MLGAALGKLRSQGDPAGALEFYEQYRRRFPAGTLREEERAARVDALVALGRRREALAEIEAMDAERLEREPRGAELLLLEAELLTEEGRCSEALPHFSAAVSRASPSSEDRALFGQGLCHAKLDAPDDAAADFRKVLERHPDGRYAEPARRQLQRLHGD